MAGPGFISDAMPSTPAAREAGYRLHGGSLNRRQKSNSAAEHVRTPIAGREGLQRRSSAGA
jgi:hypothetical protein